MAGKKGTANKKNYGTIKDKGDGKFLVTFDYGVINGKRVRQCFRPAFWRGSGFSAAVFQFDAE
jgi:hypothetical protein